MDMTVVLGLHKLSLQATIDHHRPSMYSTIKLPLSTVAKFHSIATTAKITEFEMIDTQNSSAAYLVMYKLTA